VRVPDGRAPPSRCTRCAELIEALTGAKPSPGFVHGMLARAAAAVKHANQLIRALIIHRLGDLRR